MKLSVIFNVLLLVVCCFSFYFLVISENSNERLIRQIELKDSLSKKTTKKDSVFAEKTKEYAKVITKYISDCNFKIGDKSISTPELLKISNQAIRDAALYKDSLSMLKTSNEYYKKKALEFQKENVSYTDSAFIYKGLLNVIQKNYKIYPKYQRDKNNFTFYIEGTSTIDSALVLFPYYKHNLTRDTATNEWTTVTDTERNIRRQTKKNKKSINKVSN
jgi:hypothetical protein